MSRILFVCMGNICRSPLAEGIARQHDAQGLFQIDSAGTHAYHVGSAPDPRARQLALARGCPIDNLRARQVRAEDFLAFDLILAADRVNLAELRRRQPAGSPARLGLILDWAGQGDSAEVPDPYYGVPADFEQVFDLLYAAMTALLRRISKA
jgi:protein-tyrosine phosphatase